MKRATLVASMLAAGVLLAAGGFYAGRSNSHSGPTISAAAPGSAASAGERKALYWHDPMVPGPRFDKPGKSPFMDMQLVPVYADEAGDSGVKISPLVQQNLGLRTAVVTRADLSSSFEAIGMVQFDERLTAAVQTRVAGYVERLAVRAPMEQVRKGQTLATLFAPEWLAPQNELLALKRASVAPELVAAARERMRALSIPDSLVRQSEETGIAQARFTLGAPVSGVVAELGVREGVAVSPGMTLFRIAGLEKVWAVAEVPEAQAVRLVRGRKVMAALQADPAQTFGGELKEILPQVSASTRTLQARFEVDNRAGRLMPGMLLRLQVTGATSSRLVVPAEAVIRTGTRAVAIVRREGRAFEPRELKLGAELGEQLEVLEGLREGDEVVTSGQFLIDSEARLKSVLGAMSAALPASATATAPTYRAEGKVESVDADSITISHGPVPALKWPGMTMGFGKTSPTAFANLKPGDRVSFEFRQGGPMDWELVAVQKTGGVQ
ncbi:MAG: efflux RND transporter periplasmic adaptor subunit [Roseateles asaccharophilus]|uniref:efflux RND transporter periplasmic adaptor subunit n=1 Tax=Roseateles asaccharophilus TaxID=582607 RepID=UPI00391A45EB